MRSALICVFFALIVHREGRADDEDFKPTPIPLNDWHGEKKDEPVGTLHEVISTDPPAVAAIPAHYWEDALRHSVYLTLVRDKIDQLIAKDSKLEAHGSKEVDDHNLWEKIKTAPFDRLTVEEPANLGDITIMSKGRLMEDKTGYRFTEDESSKLKCEEKCMEGVKAFWSVKRVRQRDAETVSGKYHYELTFSVNSMAPKKHKKPYDNHVRTFTVREGTPVEQPQYAQSSMLHGPPVAHAPRPQRAVWFHKNIVPHQNYQSRKNYQSQGLERFFLSLFSSEEEDEPPRYKPNPYAHQGYPGPPHSKTGNVVSQSEQHHHKKLTAYPYKPTAYKYSRPPLGPPPSASQAENHYIDSDKLKMPFSPPQVQYHYPEVDGKTKYPLSPPQIQHQNTDSDKIINPYLSQVQTQYTDSDKTKQPFPLPNHPQYSDSDKTTIIPFSQEVQHYLDDVKAKYPYPPPQTKYHYDVKSKVQPPKQHNQQYPYREPETTRNPFYPPTDHRYQPSNVFKTTRPAILPTPYQPYNLTMEVTDKLNVSEVTTKEPEVVTAYKPHPKYPQHKPPMTKISYFQEHVRPPIFNAPPGVFVTMEKKPFKPMPPLKYHQNHYPHPKPGKPRPVDFRPSPQVVDIQLFSDPDPLSDAFRPMAVNYTDNTTDSSESGVKTGNGNHKPVHNKNSHKPKPSKKHELIKSQRTTTSIPDIITAQSQPIEETDSMDWANNLLSAFVKTTPMDSQLTNITTETTTPFEPTTTMSDPTTTVTLSTTTEVKKQEKTTATPKPTKRTRPPPKFSMTAKSKKHKRITSTTTTTTSTTTTSTTEKPRFKRPTPDLIPQASSAATGDTKSKTHNDTTYSTAPTIVRVTNASTTTTTTTTSRPTTTSRSTTKLTTTPTSTTTQRATPDTEQAVGTTQLKAMNRFRQSTLMTKGTSVNHDKWSLPVIDNNKTRQSSGKYQQRRKGSNFQGYVSSTQKNVDEDHHKEHVDLAYNSNSHEISSTEMLLKVIPVTAAPTKAPEPPEPQADESEYPSVTEETEVDVDENDEDDEESKDHSEFIFSTQTESIINEIIESQDVKEDTVESTLHATNKNKTKCKKKKYMNHTTTEDPMFGDDSVEISEIVTTTTEQPKKQATTTEMDIFTQIFGGYSVAGLSDDNKTKEPLGDGSENKERFAQVDDDLEDFLHSLEEKKNDDETNDDQYNDDDDYSVLNSEDESRRSRHADFSYEEYRDRPYSFLELMAME